MADIVSWGIIIFANFFSILLGAYCVYKVIRAFLDGKDLMKYQSYFITGFLMIFILPFFITFGGLHLAELSSKGRPLVGLEFQVHSKSGTQGNVRFSESSHETNHDDEELELEIDNEHEEEKRLNIDIICQDGDFKCEKITNDVFVPSEKNIFLEPRTVLEVPISLNITEETPKGTYDLNLTVNEEDGTPHGDVSFSVNID
ncbi:MAG: hypothetical protein ACOCQG_00185 [Candidatus Nanoarchaeia archaeon]